MSNVTKIRLNGTDYNIGQEAPRKGSLRVTEIEGGDNKTVIVLRSFGLIAYMTGDVYPTANWGHIIRGSFITDYIDNCSGLAYDITGKETMTFYTQNEGIYFEEYHPQTTLVGHRIRIEGVCILKKELPV